MAESVLCLKTAFSRDQKEKIYVQDLLLQDAQLIWNSINEVMKSTFDYSKLLQIFYFSFKRKKKVNNLKTKETKPSTKNHYHYKWLLYDTLNHRLCNFDASSLFWYQEEAAVYVCGDARHMAHDVHKVLTKIIVIQGQRTPEEADQYLRAMETQGRYQKDVWVV